MRVANTEPSSTLCYGRSASLNLMFSSCSTNSIFSPHYPNSCIPSSFVCELGDRCRGRRWNLMGWGRFLLNGLPRWRDRVRWRLGRKGLSHDSGGERDLETQRLNQIPVSERKEFVLLTPSSSICTCLPFPSEGGRTKGQRTPRETTQVAQVRLPSLSSTPDPCLPEIPRIF